MPQTTASDRMTSPAPVVLGIESSCDETGVGIVRGCEILANVISSSMDEHARFGGVVPEVAARAHVEAIGPAISEALAEAKMSINDLDAIAVTAGPGLAGALMVGVAAVKGLALASGKPLYAVNHLAGHVGAEILDSGHLELPAIALLVSGGHTSLLLVRDLADDIELLGETIDDAAGEAFDKTARLLGLGYPGGPKIQLAAETGGDPKSIRFPRGLTAPKDQAQHKYDFSFSGLKTAVARWVANAESAENAGAQGENSKGGNPSTKKTANPNPEQAPAKPDLPVADIAASFQEAVVDVLLSKALQACADYQVPRLLLGGGVVANSRLRQTAAERCAEAGVELMIPDLKLCTDNGAMIASLGAQLVMAGKAPSGLDFSADSSLPVTDIYIR